MSGAILSHIEQCAAIAELEAKMKSGETAENSLFTVPERKSRVQSTIMFFNNDLCPDAVGQGRSRGREKKRKDQMEEDGKEKRRRKEQEEAALAALLSLNPQECRRVEGKVL
jgi:hypothetical protein